MNRTKLTLLAASLAMVVLGCTQGSILDSDMSEAEAKLSVDKDVIEVEAATFYEDQFISDSLIVTANRSWSLNFVSEVPWLEISQTSGINLGKVTKDWPITLAFGDNTDQQERSLELSVSIEGKRVLVPVIQKAFSPVFETDSPTSYNLPETGGEITLNVRSNCTWTAKVAESSSAKVTFDNGETLAQRTKSGSLTLSVEANTDFTERKEATIILSADGVEDITVSLTQEICIPHLNVDRELSETDVLLGGGMYEFVFDTNANWTATIDDAGAANGVTLSIENGTPADKLHVIFPDVTLEGAATVTITTETGLSESLTFTQKGGFLVSFREWPDNGGWSSRNLPFTSCINQDGETDEKYTIPREKSSALSSKENSLWTGIAKTGQEYKFHTGLSDVMFRSEACGLVIGSITQSPAFYIEFPAIEGKKLKAVRLMLGTSDVKLKNQEETATGTTSWITDAEGNIVAGGETQKVRTYQNDKDWDETQTIPSFTSDYYNHTESMFFFTLTDTQPGTAYRYTGDYRQVIRWFMLYYE